ncbi:hypothetical protein NDN08_006891 [Rhodosorus marinus]|uniref:Uncharacterized protein n=1 Tax=Rhodosorus marinus TaxID=101924 RepID=A0AAV8UMQ3_9RHOD|nr:hypothetical protein NDN08_006891 [Rhodosorus marinus]
MGCVSGKEQSSPVQKAAAKPSAKPAAAKAPVKTPEPVKAEPEPLRPKVTITETDKVTLQLRSTKDELNRLRQRSEIAMEKDKEVAKVLYTEGDKDGALLVMRKLRLSKNSLTNAENMIRKVEQQLSTLETAQANKEMFDALEATNEAMKKLENNVKIEDVDNLLQDLEERKAKTEEISALLAEENDPVAELEAEDDLKKLEKQMKKESIEELLRPATEEELLEKHTSIQKKTPLTAKSNYDIATVNEDEVEDLLKPAEPVDTAASAEEVEVVDDVDELLKPAEPDAVEEDIEDDEDTKVDEDIEDDEDDEEVEHVALGDTTEQVESQVEELLRPEPVAM